MEPLLTICIPSYNRAERVHALVLYLTSLLGSHIGNDVELLIANNCSTDDTVALLTPLVCPGITLHTHAEHYPTAELNAFNSLDFCKGQFVWFHGDDDMPTEQGISLLLEQLKNDNADIYCFNSGLMTMHGQQVRYGILNINRPHLDIATRRAPQLLGFTFYMAGMTNIVFRRTMASPALALKAYGLQQIYSHVAWLYTSFHDKRLRVMNHPLVHYRMSALETVGHFEQYAVRNNISKHTVWGFGMVKLLRFMVEESSFTPQDIARIIDLSADGGRFRFLDATLQQMYRQLMLALDEPEPRNIVSLEEFMAARDFLISADPLLFDLLKPMEILCRIGNDSQAYQRSKKLRAEARKASADYQQIYNDQMIESLYRGFFEGKHYQYQIYRCAGGYAAIHSTEDRYAVLSAADPLENIPYCFFDADRTTLLQRLEAYTIGAHTTQTMHGGIDPLVTSSLFAISEAQKWKTEYYRQASFFPRMAWVGTRYARAAAKKLLRKLR